MTVVFRADSNEWIGEGHMMRCVAIASEMRRRGEETVFVTADGYPAALLKREGFRHIVLHTDWRRADKDADTLLRVFQKTGTDVMLADSYYITPEFFRPFKGHIKTAYIDDFGFSHYPADLVINDNIYVDTIPYEQMYRNSDTRLLLGPMYVPLREEFQCARPKPVSDVVRNIMVTTGSTDPFNISGGLAKRFSEDAFFNDMRIYVVAGRYYENLNELKKMSEASANIAVCENVSRLSALMNRCDIAVSAGGTTVYELCACGTPSVIFGFADNQKRMRGSFGEKGVVIDCGDCRAEKDECMDNIIHAVKSLSSKKERSKLHNNAIRVTDGKGVMRIADSFAEAAAVYD